MNIEVLELRFPKGQGSTRAFVDIRLSDIVIRDFRIMQNGGRAYVKGPFLTYRNQSGELCFRSIVDLPDEVRGKVDTLILSAFYREKELRSGKEKE